MSFPSFSVSDVLMMFRVVGAAFGLGEQLADFAKQRYPELRKEDPGALDAVAKARAVALDRGER